MTEASRSFNTEEPVPESTRAQNGGQLIRPVISRWLPDWVRSLRHERSLADRADVATSNIRQLYPTDAAACQTRLQELQKGVCEIDADAARWADKCLSIEKKLNRAVKTQRLAAERLSVANQPLPDSNATQLSALQESYNNFTMSVEFLQAKSEAAIQKSTALNQRSDQLRVEIESLSARLIEEPPYSDPDTLSRAA